MFQTYGGNYMTKWIISDALPCPYCKREHDIWDECDAHDHERHRVRHQRQERDLDNPRKKKVRRKYRELNNET